MCWLCHALSLTAVCAVCVVLCVVVLAWVRLDRSLSIIAGGRCGVKVGGRRRGAVVCVVLGGSTAVEETAVCAWRLCTSLAGLAWPAWLDWLGPAGGRRLRSAVAGGFLEG